MGVVPTSCEPFERLVKYRVLNADLATTVGAITQVRVFSGLFGERLRRQS